MTASAQNPYSAVATGTCLVCGEPISYQVRGRPRLYCDRVRCRRRGARRRALATAWEEGRAAAGAVVAGEVLAPGPTYEDGVRDGEEAGNSEAVRLVRLLADKGDAFFLSKERTRKDFLALEQAVLVARRWLNNRRQGPA